MSEPAPIPAAPIPEGSSHGAPFHQVAYVVRDLDLAVRYWADVLGVGPWSTWTMRPPALQETLYDGREVSFGLRHALAWSGHLQFELVEPLEGPSIFADQLSRTGEGFNHLGKVVQDHPAAVAEHLARGYRPLQSARGFGQSRDGVFAYFQPPTDGAPIVELISPPSVRFPPEDVYPVPVEGR